MTFAIFSLDGFLWAREHPAEREVAILQCIVIVIGIASRQPALRQDISHVTRPSFTEGTSQLNMETSRTLASKKMALGDERENRVSFFSYF